MNDLVIGAGMGGLATAIMLARAGHHVTVIEARDRTGGLAGGVDFGERRYDGGPYILLDRPGLTWAFEQLGADVEGLLRFLPVDEAYRVRWPSGASVHVYRDLDRTADQMHATWPGSGDRYRAYIRDMAGHYDRLAPMQRKGRPGPLSLVFGGLLREVPFLLRGLEHHLTSTGLPKPVVDSLAIWTHIAGQPLSEAPAPLAFVPPIIHTHGAWIVEGGIRRIPEVLTDLARAVGVRFRLGERVDRIVRDGRRILGVEVGSERIAADRVFSNAAGIGTYVDLLSPPDPALAAKLVELPLQSPGVAAYLHIDPEPDLPFLQFWLPEGSGPLAKTRVLAHPGAVDKTRTGNARLISPTDHTWANDVGESGQTELLNRILAEDWWQEGVGDLHVLDTRVPKSWGRRYHLYRDSMNPVMTARFMRQGRLPHASPVADNLFLAGSSTHPGQWVSFCAISGVLAARAAG